MIREIVRLLPRWLKLALPACWLVLLAAATGAQADPFEIGPVRVAHGYAFTLLQNGGWTFVDLTKNYPGATESHDYSVFADASYSEQATTSASFSVNTSVLSGELHFSASGGTTNTKSAPGCPKVAIQPGTATGTLAYHVAPGTTISLSNIPAHIYLTDNFGCDTSEPAIGTTLEGDDLTSVNDTWRLGHLLDGGSYGSFTIVDYYAGDAAIAHEIDFSGVSFSVNSSLTRASGSAHGLVTGHVAFRGDRCLWEYGGRYGTLSGSLTGHFDFIGSVTQRDSDGNVFQIPPRDRQGFCPGANPFHPPKPAFQSAQSVSDPNQFSFQDTSTGEVPPFTLHWSFGDGMSSSESNPTHTYAAPGTYKVTLAVTSDGYTRSVSRTITIAALTPPAITEFAVTPGSTCTTTYFNVNVNDAYGIQTLTLDYGDGDGITEQGSGDLNYQNLFGEGYATAGMYTATLTATDVNGLTSTAQQPVTITGC